MSKLTSSVIEHTANLAKLTLSKEETLNLAKELSPVVDYISHLEKVDTQGIEPCAQTTGLENVYRNDEVMVQNILTKDEAVSGVDNAHNGFFVVDRLIKDNS